MQDNNQPRRDDKKPNPNDKRSDVQGQGYEKQNKDKQNVSQPGSKPTPDQFQKAPGTDKR